MRLTILGCSGSLAGPASPASGYLVEAEGVAPVVVDLGPGTLGILQRHIAPDTAVVLLSHLHADHCLDLPGLLVWRRFGPNSANCSRVPLYGPSGTAFRLGVASAEEPGAIDDISDTFELHRWDIEPEVVLPAVDEGMPGLSVITTRVDHPPESYALRLTSPEGRSLVYSGDTAYCEALVEIADEADVLLCEASWTHEGEHPEHIHMSGAEAGRVAALAGVGRLVLTHIPPWTDREAVAAEARAEFDGEVLVARPDMVVEI